MTIPAWNIESGFVIFGMVMVQTPFEMLFIYLERQDLVKTENTQTLRIIVLASWLIMDLDFSGTQDWDVGTLKSYSLG